MTYLLRKIENLTKEEWNEMIALKNAISERPQSVSAQKMEEFSAYLVQSFRQRGG